MERAASTFHLITEEIEANTVEVNGRQLSRPVPESFLTCWGALLVLCDSCCRRMAKLSYNSSLRSCRCAGASLQNVSRRPAVSRLSVSLRASYVSDPGRDHKAFRHSILAPCSIRRCSGRRRHVYCLAHIVVSILRESFSDSRLISFLLVLPIIPLGIYCVFPHPFYDPDAAFVILFLILILLRNERHGFPLFPSFLTGILLVVPLFIKQNIGLAFLVGVVTGLLAVLAVDLVHRRPIGGQIAAFGGIGTGIIVAAIAVHYWVGLDNYKYWTWTFATARRAPTVADMLSVYQDAYLALWLLMIGIGVSLLWLNKSQKAVLTVAAVAFMAIPFLWPAIYLSLDQDSSERAERLVNLWPVVLLASLGMSLIAVRKTAGLKRVLPIASGMHRSRGVPFTATLGLNLWHMADVYCFDSSATVCGQRAH